MLVKFTRPARMILAFGIATVSAAQAYWSDDAVRICTNRGTHSYPVSVPDSSGGMVLVWDDEASDVYCQRVDASGNLQWASGGVAVCTAPGDQGSSCATADGEGGALIAWSDGRSGTATDIYAQRVNASGLVQWAPDGVPVCITAAYEYFPQVVPDGTGGAIITWFDKDYPYINIYAQRVDGSGVVQWITNGVLLCATITGEWPLHRTISDGSGGAIIAWQDGRSGREDIYAQRIDSQGVVRWIPNGLALCSREGHQMSPAIVADGTGGAIVAWKDRVAEDSTRVHAQRVNALGAAQWIEGGIAVSELAAGGWDDLEILADGAQGAIATWAEGRVSSERDIYAQRISATGSTLWQSGGAPICTVVGPQYGVTIVPGGAGSGIVSWIDGRSGSATEVYAQLIDGSGRTGHMAPDLISVRDVPGDQGGKVYLAWRAARADLFQDDQMSHYTLWRALDEGLMIRALDSGNDLLKRHDLRIQQVEGRTFFWELVDTIQAYGMEAYGKPVATLFDSTSSCDEFHYFQVVAHTLDSHVFWTSQPDSGRSVDNLAPHMPTGLVAVYQSGVGTALGWDEPVDADVRCFKVYRSTEQDFVADGETLVGETVTSSWLDEVALGGTAYYKVSAVDFSANESELAPASVTPTDAAEAAAPGRFALYGVTPNPVVARATVRYDVPWQARVKLVVYDVAGRKVRTLVDELQQPGARSVLWDGFDDHGRAVPRAVYFCRMDAEGFRQVCKVMVAR